MTVLKRASMKAFNLIKPILSDKTFVSLQYRLYMGRKLNLKAPKTFNEKLNWLKLYDRNPLYTTLVDKYAVKQWVSERIGPEYVIPTIGNWVRPEDIDWDSLPNQFVLKTTHGGGGDGVIICKDKSKLNIDEVIAKLNHSMDTDPYKRVREWPYKNVNRQIIAEKFMEQENSQSNSSLTDYKFFCFDGKVKYLFIATDRNKKDEEVKFDYFDSDFNHLDLIQHHPMSGKNIPKPTSFEKMKYVAGVLSQGIPQVRVDLYEINGRVYFGEMTFFHHGAITPFHPESWDYEWGKYIDLPHIQ